MAQGWERLLWAVSSDWSTNPLGPAAQYEELATRVAEAGRLVGGWRGRAT